jgi:hypothetical protein
MDLREIGFEGVNWLKKDLMADFYELDKLSDSSGIGNFLTS